ncbi:MAG: hypothetical protein L0220_21325 [Acidobacteria bacterium]|nr:hypothetical protein [Acidobacteriota bacterium]
MYCPNCATPIDGVKFCRSCGSNVSLVPQALSGELKNVTNDLSWKRQSGRHRRKDLNIETTITTIFTGIGFLFVAIIVHFFIPAGIFWGWSLLIPAFACIGHGIGHYMQWKENQKQEQFPQSFLPHQINQPERAPQIIAPETSKVSPPDSVTEVTTKHLDLPRRSE